MSETETEERSSLAQFEELLPEIADALERLKTQIVENSDDEDVIETAEEVWDVLDQTEDVLDTLDIEEIPDVIDVDELPSAVETEEVPDAIAAGEAHQAIDLSALKEAIELRELWQAADVSELREEQKKLESEVDDVTGDDADAENEDGLLGTSGVIGTGGGAHTKFDAEDRQEKIQSLIETAVEKFRAVLLKTHDKLRVLYELNQEKLGGSDSLNPTAVSTMPSGPLANSASTRRSTVPSQVRHARAKNPRRIYGRRFENANTE